jgi:outer membrane receptor protein involved in Fe transport
VARQRIGTVRQDSVDQVNGALWWQADWQATEQLHASLGLRGDIYHFDVDSDNPLNSGQASSRLFSPKFGLAWRTGKDTDLYYNWGRGFHSNDGRGATIQVDPKTGAAADKANPLVRAEGKEIGLRAVWLPNWHSTLALFQLDIDSELLFVGDVGATEASRPSKRTGIE